jgi:drug/metabolite transporter (DMT)-like permease
LTSAPDRTGTPHHQARGRWLVFGATFFWGTSATLARFMFRDRHLPPLTLVELRLAISVLLLASWLLWRRPASLRLRREDLGYFLVLGLCGVAAIQCSYYYSVSVLGVGLAILIQYLAPTLIVLYDALRGVRVGAPTLAALAGALAGTALLVGNVNPAAIGASPFQWAVSFSSAVFFAFYVVFSKRALDRYPPMTVLLYTFSIAGVFLAFITPPWKIAAAGYDGETWLLILVLGVFSALVPFTLFYSGLRHLTPAEAGILATLEPVVAVGSSALVLGEGLLPPQWLGAALVLIAAALATYRRDRPLPSPEPPRPGS